MHAELNIFGRNRMLATDKFQQLLLCSMDAADHKIIYILLDGIGDLPHPSLNNLTPLG